MRTQMLVLLNVAASLLISMTLSGNALGCSCGPTTINDKTYALSERIIIGEIIETKSDRLDGREITLLHIKVEKAWKQKTEKTLWLPLLDMKGWCGDMDIAQGKKYFLRTIKFRGGIAVMGDCGVSRLLEYAEDDLKYLAKKPHWSYSEKGR